MFANVRELYFMSEKLAAGDAQVREFLAYFDRQPGLRGQLAVAAGEGRILALEVWESEAQYLASRDAVNREAGRLTKPLMADVPQPGIVGAGEVAYMSPGLSATPGLNTART